MTRVRVPSIDINVQRSDFNTILNDLSKDVNNSKVLQNLNKNLYDVTSQFSDFCNSALKSFSNQWNNSAFLKNVGNTLSDLGNRISTIKITIERPEATPNNVGVAILVTAVAAGVWWLCTRKNDEGQKKK
jgi:prophage DNA circulation protein